jgi:hypothetical protein
MKNRWKFTATAAVFVVVCFSMHAQTANLPSAPTAPLPATSSPVAQGKPSFALPAPTFTLPTKSSSNAKTKDFCYDSPDGLFSERNQGIPDGLKGIFHSYVEAIYSEIFSGWTQHMTLGEKNAWAKGRTVAARFVVYPDGSYSTPSITLSSGNDRDDAHALDAINSRGSFAPLPAGINHPVPICVLVGFNRNVEKDPSAWMRPSPGPQH